MLLVVTNSKIIPDRLHGHAALPALELLLGQADKPRLSTVVSLLQPIAKLKAAIPAIDSRVSLDWLRALFFHMYPPKAPTPSAPQCQATPLPVPHCCSVKTVQQGQAGGTGARMVVSNPCTLMNNNLYCLKLHTLTSQKQLWSHLQACRPQTKAQLASKPTNTCKA